MQVLSRIDEVRDCIHAWRSEGDVIAFVPTMGNLHPGHLALIDRAHMTHAAAGKLRLVVSIFVNPMQFGKNEDLSTYPRTFEEDKAHLEHKQVDLLFAPTPDVIYPRGMQKETRVVPPVLADILEGESRPGFFTGVATVVNKLFNIVQPDIAVFGEKDYQQLLVIRQMVKDFALPVKIVSAPIVREDDGLAMSSRNNYLDADQRVTAAKMHVCLTHLVEEVSRGGDCQYAVMHVMQELEKQGFIVDYVVVRRRTDLAVPRAEDSELIALVAARVGSTRLIDNILFERTAT